MKSILKSIIYWALVVLFIVGIVSVAVFFIEDLTGGKSDGVSSLSGKVIVNYNNVALKNGDNVELPENGQARFEVSNGGNYTVQVLPNVTKETDFDYVVDGVPRSFAAETGFTDYFVSSSNKSEKYFSVACSYERYTLEGLLGYYNGSGVVVETDIEYPYKLVVTSSNGSSVTVNLKQNNSEKTIEFDTSDDIVF